MIIERMGRWNVRVSTLSREVKSSICSPTPAFAQFPADLHSLTLWEHQTPATHNMRVYFVRHGQTDL